MVQRPSALQAPFLRSIRWREGDRPQDTYPFNLPIFKGADFELIFTNPVTILVGENAAGKSTLLEALAELAGFHAGGGSRDHNYQAPGATLLHLTTDGIAEVNYRATPHFRMMAEFFADPDRMVAEAMATTADGQDQLL